jgi:Arc/MetJ-type ribon-helix-helix transcriptional regulator
MTKDDESSNEKRPIPESGIEYRATIRFPQKDYEFMQRLIDEGEYTNVTEIVRDAVKRFRIEWRDNEAMRNFMPNAPWMDMGAMPWMRTMRRRMHECGNSQRPYDQEDSK